MKRFLLILTAALLAMGLAVCLTPEIVKTDVRLAVGLWELARPPGGMDSDSYFRKSQWLADLRTVQAGFRFLWETARTEKAAANSLPPWPSGTNQLLTHSGGSSNNLAAPIASAGDPT